MKYIYEIHIETYIEMPFTEVEDTYPMAHPDSAEVKRLFFFFLQPLCKQLLGLLQNNFCCTTCPDISKILRIQKGYLGYN